MRTVAATANIGGIGNAKPHQNAAPKAKTAKESMAPDLAPLHKSHPATHSSKQTNTKAESKGTVV